MDFKGWVKWYQASARDLPWRESPTPYRVWVSEIMLQQTQVRTMLPYYERWMERFPTVQALAKASEEEVLSAWAGLGYYSRARNLWKAARFLVEECEGVFPEDRKGWEALSGVGPYTAGAVLSIAFHQPEAIVDGNVERVVCRVFRWKDRVEQKQAIWGCAGDWVKEASREGLDPGDFNQALMELGARVCTVKRPDCMRCPIREGCAAFKSGKPENYPQPKVRAKTVAMEEFCALWVTKTGDVLLREIPKGEWRAGLWDVPHLEMRKRVEGEDLGEFRTRHVVTHHRIERITRVYQVEKAFRARKGEAWYVLEDLIAGQVDEIGLSAPARKTLIELNRFLPQRLAQSSLNFASRLSAASGVKSFKLVR